MAPRAPALGEVIAPRLLLTPGEPAGIGPDLVIQLAQQPFKAILAAVCDPGLLKRRAKCLDLAIDLRVLGSTAELQPHYPGILQVLPVPLAVQERPGSLDPRNAGYVLETLRHAATLVRDGSAEAMVTGPVNKAAIIEGGYAFSGHTEFLAEFLGTAKAPLTPVMMLAAGSLRVALATTHLALRAVADAITADGLDTVLQVLHAALRDLFGIANPLILVCGLNPHAGEGGHLGDEEQRIILPVLQRLRAQGLRLQGPLPADTLFTPRTLQGADAVLAMYHDQGLPVLKYAGFGRAVNITLGLPIVRTSVDHGTALELAGSGGADPGSLLEAIEMAAALARSRSAQVPESLPENQVPDHVPD